MLGAPVCLGQTSNPPPARVGNYAVIGKIGTSVVPTGMDLTVTCTKPVAPEFTRLQNPERLVIDLPDTLVGTHPPSVEINGPDVHSMRINQFRKSPPVTRIVLDLMGDREFSYEPDGTSFVVHLRSGQPPAHAKPEPESPPAIASEGTVGLGLPGNGAVVMAGNHTAGSAITAGADTAIVRLERGGEVRVCPGTTVSVTPSSNGRAVMLGMSDGAVELHYSLASSADTVLTPDFRILLPGPGEFHYAISADTKGNTCVRSLQGNTASAVVSELMGDGTYQVKPVEQVVFHSGRLNQTDTNVPLECGCPPPRQPQLLAAVPVEPGAMRAVLAPTDKPVPPPPALDTSERPNAPLMAQVLATDPLPANPSANPPPAKQPPAQVVVDAPFVFRASDLPPDISNSTATLPTARSANPIPLPLAAPPVKVRKAKKERTPAQSRGVQSKKEKQPEPAKSAVAPQSKPPAQTAANPPQPRTFLGRVKNFFRSIFK